MISSNQTIYLYHNKRCSKSRQALEFLNKNNIPVIIIDYLNKAIDKDLLKKTLLTLKDNGVIRKEEKIFNQLKIPKNNLANINKLELIIKHPILLQRPIIVKEINKKMVAALICRPVELIKNFF